MALVTSSGAKGLCPLCGAAKQSCTGHGTDVTPVDDPMFLTSKGSGMTEPQELSEYTWEQNGQEMTGRLTQADAERLGARPAGESGASGDDSGSDRATGKARKAQNK